MTDRDLEERIELDMEHPIWECFFAVSPLVIVGTKEEDGSYDLAPKHMVVPLSWQNHIGFVCTPHHSTYKNAEREGCFTVSFLRPDQIVLASLAAAPRCEDHHKHSLEVLPTFKATQIDGVFLEHAYLHLECELERTVDGFGENSLIAGKIVAGQVAADAARNPDVDDQDLVAHTPLLAYLYPGRYASIHESNSFPFHQGFAR